MQQARVIKLEGASVVSCALHLEKLYEDHIIADKTDRVGIGKKYREKRVVSHILFRNWVDLKALKLTEMAGCELVRVRSSKKRVHHVLSKHSSYQSSSRSSILAYGHKPGWRKNQVLAKMRRDEPLASVRIAAEPGIEAGDLGALVRTSSLAGCHSVTLLNHSAFKDIPASAYDPKAIRGSAGAVFTIPVYENGTLVSQ